MQKVRNAPSDTDGLDSAERPSGDQSRVSSSGEEGLQPALLLRLDTSGPAGLPPNGRNTHVRGFAGIRA